MRRSRLEQWVSDVNGKRYTFSHEKKGGKHIVTVNGRSIMVKRGFMSVIRGFDEPFIFDGINARVVVTNITDIVINGEFIRSGEKYVPRLAWGTIFGVLCLLIPICNLWNLQNAAFYEIAVTMIFGVLFMGACIAISRSSLSTMARISMCIFFIAFCAVIVFGVLHVEPVPNESLSYL